MIQLHRILHRKDGVAETAVALFSVGVQHHGAVSGDEPGRLQLQHVLAHGVVAGTDGLSDGLIAERTLIGLPVLPIEQEGIDGDGSASKVQVEDFIRQREKLFVGTYRDEVRCDEALLHQLCQNGIDDTGSGDRPARRRPGT